MAQRNLLAVVPVVNMFTNPTGKEYTLAWSSGSGKGRSGYVRMTDLLFNYYFYPTAFGLDGAYEERTVAQSLGVKMVREIGKPPVTYDRSAYTLRVVPTTRSSGYDSGHQLYAVDGDDLWNFEVGGRLTEFRIWVDQQATLTNLKRAFVYRTITGVGAGATPITAPSAI